MLICYLQITCINPRPPTRRIRANSLTASIRLAIVDK
ncbi:unnamed protein product [Schistosoma curassoni]|uniref:Uncharacterized protein n=1 Tax=Schistosoma curassoni TaxID=6186 RepID=A0A183JQJ0_9TREM|nr:unnamed protein product [Schistosoma curassoni]